MKQFILHNLFSTIICVSTLVIGVPIIHYYFFKKELEFLEKLSKIYTDTLIQNSLDTEEGLKIKHRDDPLMKGIHELRIQKSHFLNCVRRAHFDKDLVSYHESLGNREGIVSGPAMQLIDSTELFYAPSVQALIDHVIGYHRDKKKNSFNPIYWVLLIPQLPKSIIDLIIQSIKKHLLGL